MPRQQKCWRGYKFALGIDKSISESAEFEAYGVETLEIHVKKLMGISVLAFGLASGSALAGMATGDQINTAISGNTVQGNMDASGAYTEFYAADGTAFGKDYKAKWSVEGDTVCWLYDGQPKDCWGVDIAGDQVKWVKDGKVQGSGTIVAGNPNDFK